MVSSYTARNRLNKQGTGDNTNTWGDILNAGVFDLVDAAMDGWTSVNPTGGVTLTTVNGAADQGRARCLKLIAATTSAVTTIPPVEKWYIVWNAATAAQTIASAGGGTSVSIQPDEIVLVISDAVNVKRLNPLSFSGAGLSFSGGPVSFGAQRLTAVADPAGPQDAATKAYADALAFNANAGVLPGQGGSAGKFLMTNGTVAGWGYAVTVGSGMASVSNNTLTVSSASANETRAGSLTSKALSPGDVYNALAEVTLTDASTIAVDMSTFINARVTLGGNRVLGNPSNPKVGQTGYIAVVQDGTGSRTLSFGSNWKRQGSAPTPSTTAGAIDFLQYQVITSSYILYDLIRSPS